MFYIYLYIHTHTYTYTPKGAHYVIHTASPFLFNDKIKNPNDIIEPALVGTRNVLNSASKSSTVKRVVLTASQFAVHGDYNERGSADGKGGHLFTEDDWNETSSPTYQPYPYSKVVAEVKML